MGFLFLRFRLRSCASDSVPPLLIKLPDLTFRGIDVARGACNKKDITIEPETKELKRMIRNGELNLDRAVEHLKEADDKQHEPDHQSD